MADEPKLNLRQKLLAAMGDVGGIAKQGKNTQGAGYAYQRMADMLPKVQAAFLSHGIVFLADHQSTEDLPTHESKAGGTIFATRVRMKYFLFDTESDEKMEAGGGGTAFDTSDKAENKAKTAALKYFLKHTLLIGEEDDDAAEKESIQAKYRGQGETRGRVKTVMDAGAAGRSPNRVYEAAVKAGLTTEDVVQLAHATAAAKQPSSRGDGSNRANQTDIARIWAEGVHLWGQPAAKEWFRDRFKETQDDGQWPVKNWTDVQAFQIALWWQQINEIKGRLGVTPEPSPENPPADDNIDFETQEEERARIDGLRGGD